MAQIGTPDLPAPLVELAQEMAETSIALEQTAMERVQLVQAQAGQIFGPSARAFGWNGQAALLEAWTGQRSTPHSKQAFYDGFALYYQAGLTGEDMGQVYNRYARALTEPQKQAAYRAGQQDAAVFAARGRNGAGRTESPVEDLGPLKEQAPKTVLDDGSKDELTISSARDTMANLTEDEKGALIKYVGPDAYRLNAKLRRGEMLTESEREWVKNLDKALEKMPVYQGTIYRSLSAFGIADVDAFIKSYVVGRTEIFPSYLSASTSVYDESFPIQYVIKSKKGRDIRAYNQSEQEILFMRDSVFRVTKVDGNTIYMEEL